MHIEEWSASRVAAVLASLKDAGITESRLARMAGVNRSQVNRWSRGENRPGYDAARRLAVAVYRDHPDLARELVAASGYVWAEPQDVPEPDPLVPQEVLEVLERVYKGEPEQLREAVRALEAIERERRQTDVSHGERRAG